MAALFGPTFCMHLSHRRLSVWYHQLAQQLEAGVPLAEALRAVPVAGVPASGSEAMAQQIEAGGSVDDALRLAPWLPAADRLFLAAAAGVGRMPRTLYNLADRHEQLRAVQGRMLLAGLYPAVVVHLGLLLWPVLRMVDWEKGFVWDGFAYARSLAWTLLPLWLLVAVGWALARRQSPVLHGLAHGLPGLRGYVRAQALADLAFALGNFLDAGLPIAQAWATAGAIIPSRELQTAATALAQAAARGEAPGAHLGAWACFPAEFVALYRTGEKTGRLEQNLLRLAAEQQERARRALNLAAMLYPALLFLIVAGAVAYAVLSFYAGYLGMLGKMAE